MNDWNIEINIAWPHERLRLGFELIQPNEEHNYYTLTLDLLILSIYINWN